MKYVTLFLKVLFGTKTKAEEEKYSDIYMVILIIASIITLIIMIVYLRINYEITSGNPVNNYILNNDIFLNTEK